MNLQLDHFPMIYHVCALCAHIHIHTQWVVVVVVACLPPSLPLRAGALSLANAAGGALFSP